MGVDEIIFTRKELDQMLDDAIKYESKIYELEKQNEDLRAKLSRTNNYLIKEYNDYTLNIQL